MPAAVALCLSAVPLAANDREIDVRLFEKSQVDLRKSCSLALWQSDKDPHSDRFAYIFVELMDKRHARQPARIRIGTDVVQLRRVATGGKKGGYDLYEYQTYRMTADHSYVVLQLKLGPIEGEAVEIESGFLNVIQPGKVPARIAVKGGAGCW